MKPICHILIAAVVMLSGCQTAQKHTADSSENGDFLAALKTLSPTQQEALDAALAEAADIKTRSGNASGYVSPLSLIDSYEWSAYDYYELDVEKFMRNPVIENFVNSVSIATDRVLLAGVNKDKKYSILELARLGGGLGWKPARIGELKPGQYTWLEEAVAGSDSGTFGVVDIYGRQYYILTTAGVLEFYSPSGMPQPAENVFRRIEMGYDNIKAAMDDPAKLRIY